jgi:hypothetical protein
MPRPKFTTLPANICRQETCRRDGAFQIRIVSAVLASIAALALLPAPVLAKNSNAPRTDDKSSPSQCHSPQEGPGGAWIEIPCQELGVPSQTQHKPEGRNAEQAQH